MAATLTISIVNDDPDIEPYNLTTRVTDYSVNLHRDVREIDVGMGEYKKYEPTYFRVKLEATRFEDERLERQRTTS